MLDYFESSIFNICPHQPLQTMKGKPINFIPETAPTKFHIIGKEGLVRSQLGALGWWLHQKMMACPGAWQTYRSSMLILRETHYAPFPFNQGSVVLAHMRKTVLDTWNGYHNLPLSPDAHDTTTFITEWGRYFWAPQGFHKSKVAYTHQFDDITINIWSKNLMFDDSILWDNSTEASFLHTMDYNNYCSNNGIVFNFTS